MKGISITEYNRGVLYKDHALVRVDETFIKEYAENPLKSRR